MIVNILDIQKHYSWINHGSNFFSCSGNVVIETKFFDDDLHVSTSRVRLFYVWDMEPLFYYYYFFSTVSPKDGPITSSFNIQRRHSTYRVLLLRRCDNSIKREHFRKKLSFKTNDYTSFMADKDLYIRAIMLMTTWVCKLPVCIFFFFFCNSILQCTLLPYQLFLKGLLPVCVVIHGLIVLIWFF